MDGKHIHVQISAKARISVVPFFASSEDRLLFMDRIRVASYLFWNLSEVNPNAIDIN
jgi:hypothetical protein